MREWVNLKAYAQKDPLLEYKREAFLAYEEMQKTVRKDVIEKLMRIQLVIQRPPDVEQQTDLGAANPEQNVDEEVLEALRPKRAPQKLMFHGGGAPSAGGGVEEVDRGIPRSQRRKLKRRKIRKN